MREDYARQDHPREKEFRPEQNLDARLPDYGDDYDDYVQRRRRRLFSMVTDEPDSTPRKTSSTSLGWQDRQKESKSIPQNVSQPQPGSQRPVQPEDSAILLTSKHLLHLPQNLSVRAQTIEAQVKKIEPLKARRRSGRAKRAKVRAVETTGQPKPEMAEGNQQPHAGEAAEQPGPKKRRFQKGQKMREAQQKLKHQKLEALEEEHIAASKKGHQGERSIQKDTDAKKRLREKEIEMNVPLQQDEENGLHSPPMKEEKNENRWSEQKDEELPAWTAEEEEEDNREVRMRENGQRDRVSVWGPEDGLEGTEEEDPTPPPVFDADVNWSQTFQVNHLDLQALRSDWIDLRCNISGNLVLEASDAMPIVKAFVEKLNEKHQW